MPTFQWDKQSVAQHTRSIYCREIRKIYHRINADLEDRQANHQSAIVEIEGTISNHTLSILISPGATLSYITPKMMELS